MAEDSVLVCSPFHSLNAFMEDVEAQKVGSLVWLLISLLKEEEYG